MRLQYLMRHSDLASRSICHGFAQLATKPVLQHVPSVHLAYYHRPPKYLLNNHSKSYQVDLRTMGCRTAYEKSNPNTLPNDVPSHLSSLPPMKNPLQMNTFSTSTFKGSREDIGDKKSGASDTDNQYVLSVGDIVTGSLLVSLVITAWINRRSARHNLISALATDTQLKSLIELRQTTNSPLGSSEMILSKETLNSQSHQFVYNEGENSPISELTRKDSEEIITNIEVGPFVDERKSGSQSVIKEKENDSLPGPSDNVFSKTIESKPTENAFSKTIESVQPHEEDHDSSAFSTKIPKKGYQSYKSEKPTNAPNGKPGYERPSSNFLKTLNLK